MSEPPTRLDLLRFSYAEVLDATKHQDDKVGRLLGAVAFLTGGALVFANTDLLNVDVDMSGHTYPLGAATLAGFIVLTLVSVGVYLTAMAAPLTLPREASSPDSHIYFRSIAGMSKKRWQDSWEDAGLAHLEEELSSEIRNIADRADRKYSRTTIGTNIFLGALVLLAPTVVLGITAGSRTDEGVLAWDTTLRWYVAISVMVMVGSLVAPLAFDARDPKVIGRAAPLVCLLFTYVGLLGAIIVADPADAFFEGGAWVMVVLGVASVALTIGAYVGKGRQWVPYSLGIAAVAAGGFAAWCADRSDLQLLVALAGGVLVVLPNIFIETRHRARSRSIV